MAFSHSRVWCPNAVALVHPDEYDAKQSSMTPRQVDTLAMSYTDVRRSSVRTTGVSSWWLAHAYL